MSHPPAWVKRFTKPRNLRVIASIASLAEGLDGALEAAITHERQLEKGTRRTLGTIHKAKGLELPNVLISNFSNADFPITDQLPTRLRVWHMFAISRATESLTFLAPGGAVSPWLLGNVMRDGVILARVDGTSFAAADMLLSGAYMSGAQCVHGLGVRAAYENGFGRRLWTPLAGFNLPTTAAGLVDH